MSWKASAYVLDLAKAHPWLTITQLAVLYALGARHHQDDHCAWGLLARIMEDTHASESTVSHVLGELEDRGIITAWEGQFPQRKGDSDDRRRTRGLFFCFVGLDPDDGPAYKGVTRHVRHGGASSHQVADDAPEAYESVANGATYSVANAATHFDGSDESELQHSVRGLQLISENELQTVDPRSGRSGRLNPGPPTGGPAGPEPAGRPRAPDAAAPRHAPDVETGPDEPDRLPNGAQKCPLCPQVFTGTYADHLASASTHKIRAKPEDFNGRRPSDDGVSAAEIRAELAAMAQRMPMPPNAELLAEHERMLDRERQRLRLTQTAQEPAPVVAAADG